MKEGREKKGEREVEREGGDKKGIHLIASHIGRCTTDVAEIYIIADDTWCPSVPLLEAKSACGACLIFNIAAAERYTYYGHEASRDKRRRDYTKRLQAGQKRGGVAGDSRISNGKGDNSHGSHDNSNNNSNATDGNVCRVRVNRLSCTRLSTRRVRRRIWDVLTMLGLF